MNERKMQAILMNWAMNVKQHVIVVPNIHYHGFINESDLISITKSGLTHEYEIKISRADFLRDKFKTKHDFNNVNRRVNYFWYAIYGFEITENELINQDYGIMRIVENGYFYKIDITKNAKRLNESRVIHESGCEFARLLSFRLTNFYLNHFYNDIKESQ